MFGWLGKREKKLPRRSKDLVWISAEAKWHALPGLVVQKAPVWIYGWYAETIEKARQVLKAAHMHTTVNYGTDFSPAATTRGTVIVLEHYPLPQKEEAILSATDPAEILVLSALDEPLLKHFGGERLALLVQKLGLEPNDFLEHSMISNSIARAQQKINEKLIADFSAHSPEEWFRYSGVQNT
ncbi:MAG: hypothetical protein MUF24_13085 [Chitinophagaceae bacterium]|jgi:hypothetical protein|nr:hypothetical protein [Chitinophagaceae bacterium]